MTDPAISVCIPMYNNRATIARCLRSILDQEGTAFEIVVVDDDSSDGCAAIAASMLRPGDRLIHNVTRLGLNGNHNKCLEAARGTCIQFVHADDWLLPGALKKLVLCFDDPAVGLAFAPRRVVHDNVPWWLRPASNPHRFFLRLRGYNRGPFLVAQMTLLSAGGNLIGEPTCVMFRRWLALEAGGFRNDVYQLVDLDLWLRLMLRSAVCFVPQPLSVRKHTVGTETVHNVRTRRGWLDHLRILTWLIVDPASTTAIRALAGAWWLLLWLALHVQVAALGPERKSRLKTLAQAPVREFAHARRLADRLA
jgi:glycosyltransferase involved in cell wall biosynthesis